MDLDEFTDDELVTELGHAVEAAKEARRYVDEVLVVAAGRQSIKNPVLMGVLGIRDRAFYNRLRDARFPDPPVTPSEESQ